MSGRDGAMRALNVLFLDPFHGGSHEAFAAGWAAWSRHRITTLTLPARFWKWRIRGAAFAFAERLAARSGRTSARGPRRCDVVVATSQMNAAEFVAASGLTAPLVVYMHENQLSYPRPPDEPLDHGLALASFASAAAARLIVFNSKFHRAAFLEALASWMTRFPEHAPRRTARAIARKARVAYPGIDWPALSRLALRSDGGGKPDRAEPDAQGARRRARRSDSGGDPRGGPLILWNHRWEFDKNPGAFFAAIGTLADRGLAFRLALLGENSQAVPKPFLEARERFGPRIVRFGFAPSQRSYRAWLGRADIIVSTARQENFGIAVAEAIAAGAFPLLPARLSYPELLPAWMHGESLYRGQADLVGRLERVVMRPALLGEGRKARSSAMRRFDWARTAPKLDALITLADLAFRVPRSR